MEPQLFAIVNFDNHDEIYCYGLDLGEEGAYTIRRDPNSGRLDFGAWHSMETAFRRFRRALRNDVKLHLIVLEIAQELDEEVMRDVYPELFDDDSEDNGDEDILEDYREADTTDVQRPESMSIVGLSR
jgi:hypothetical protein